MDGMYGDREKQALIREIKTLCEKYQDCSVRVEGFREKNRIVQQLCRLCVVGSGIMDVHCPELLIALLDAYEVVRDEQMLQKVLDTVSRDISLLVPSWINVRLLTFCYYYTEDGECADLVKQMISVLTEEASGEQKEMHNDVLRECRDMIPDLGI